MKKTLFITGGSRGIGRGIALVFAQNGYDVAFTYHTAENAAVTLKKEIEQLGQKAYYRQASLEEVTNKIRPGISPDIICLAASEAQSKYPA